MKICTVCDKNVRNKHQVCPKCFGQLEPKEKKRKIIFWLKGHKRLIAAVMVLATILTSAGFGIKFFRRNNEPQPEPPKDPVESIDTTPEPSPDPDCESVPEPDLELTPTPMPQPTPTSTLPVHTTL